MFRTFDYDVESDYKLYQVPKLRVLLNRYLEKNIVNPNKIKIKDSIANSPEGVYALRRIKSYAIDYIRSGYTYQIRMANFLCLPEKVQSIVYGLSSLDELISVFEPPVKKLNAFKKNFEKQLELVYTSSERHILRKLSNYVEYKAPIENKEKEKDVPVKIDVQINGDIKIPELPKFQSSIDQANFICDQIESDQGDSFSSIAPSKDSPLIEIEVTDEEYRKIQEMRFAEFKKQEILREQKLKEDRLRKRKEEELKKKNHKIFKQKNKKR